MSGEPDRMDGAQAGDGRINPAPAGDGRAARRLRRHAILRTLRKGVIFTGGSILVLAGLMMLVLPGPGILVLILGFAVLALEFAWARRVTDNLKGRADAARRRISRPRRPNRRRDARG